jgi:hypothetical protein
MGVPVEAEKIVRLKNDSHQSMASSRYSKAEQTTGFMAS